MRDAGCPHAAIWGLPLLTGLPSLGLLLRLPDLGPPPGQAAALCACLCQVQQELLLLTGLTSPSLLVRALPGMQGVVDSHWPPRGRRSGAAAFQKTGPFWACRLEHWLLSIWLDRAHSDPSLPCYGAV